MQDRIKQMAVEAGGVPLRENCIEADAFPWGVEMEIDALARFARLVAEDCARVCDERWRCMKSTEAAHYRQTGQPFFPAAFGFNPSDYAGKSFADTIRARYAETNAQSPD